MSKTALQAETVIVLAVVAAAVHFGAGLDWPGAILVGAVASVFVRAVVHRRPGTRL